MKRDSLWFAAGIPFYLISAACMLGGCLAINSSLTWRTTPILQDIILIGQLNVYELALIGLAWFLVRRGKIHDAVMLAAIEAFFLVDVSFLNAQIATCNFALWLAVSITVLLSLAAMVKLALLAKIAGLSWRDGRLAAMLIQLAVMFAIPTIYRRFDSEDLPPGFLYGGWWAAGLLIPLSFWISQFRGRAAAGPVLPGIVRLLCVLPWLSLLLHLGMLQWVYNVTFFAANIAPILLGLACVLYHVQPSEAFTRGNLIVAQCILLAIAVLVSLSNPADLCHVVGKHGRFTVTPGNLALAGAYLACVYCFARRYAARFLALGAAGALVVIFGPSARDVGQFGSRGWNLLCRIAWWVIPKTVTQVGIAAIVAAFAFLGVGAAVSLRRTATEPKQSQPDAPGAPTVQP